LSTSSDGIELSNARFRQEIEHLRQQDALEFSNTEVRIEWEVTVESPESATPKSIWEPVKELTAVYTVLSIARKARGWMKQRRLQSDQEDETEDDENPNLTLDEFREK